MKHKAIDPLPADKGRQAEDAACRYLIQQRLHLIQRNFQCRFGEIDLIMQDQHELVFVEVRFRANNAFGDAADSVHWHKQQRLIRSAQYYLQQLPQLPCCRFDVVALANTLTQIQWIKDAFQVTPN
jgi:putative endonuclease